jgi:hypothetical protein
MKHRSGFGLLAILLTALVLAPPASAQLEDNLGAYTDETAEGYLKPLQEAFGQALNSNFFTNAAIPKVGYHARFEIRAMSVFFGSGDETFRAAAGGDFASQEEVDAPTVVGPTESVSVTDQGTGTTYVFPGGFDLSSLTIGVPQLTISAYATEAVLRWIAVDTGDAEIGDVKLFGLGVRHNVSQYFTNFPLDLAGAFYYQTFKLGDDLIDARSISFGLQGSKSFSVLRPFGGISFDTSSMDATYTSNTTGDDTEVTLQMDSERSLHLTAGAALDFGPVEVHLAGELAQRFGVSAGLGFGF